MVFSRRHHVFPSPRQDFEQRVESLDIQNVGGVEWAQRLENVHSVICENVYDDGISIS